MTKIGICDAGFADFFTEAFEQGCFGTKELRLSLPEAEQVRRAYPDAALQAVSPACTDGKTWFEVRFGGCPER
jgi:hypothetical protein